MTQRASIRDDCCATGRARDFHAAVRKNKMRGILALAFDGKGLPFRRPTVKLRNQFMRVSRKFNSQRRPSTRYSIDKNFRTERLATDTHRAIDECE